MVEIGREKFLKRRHLIFAAIGSAIGLGNVWRFPYMCYNYGGAAFLVAYVIGLFAIGIPWLVTEFAMGHYFQKGAPEVFSNIGKKWEWVGWFPAVSAFLIDSYYCVIMAWTLIYMFSSMTLAWGVGPAGAEGAGPYFFEQVLQITDGPGVLGGMRWQIVLSLAFTWIVIYFVIRRGAEIIGKVSEVVMTLAWILIFAIIARSVTLIGAVDGLNYYLDIDWSVLKGPGVWFAAFSQIAFTMSLGMAGMYAYGRFIAKKGDITNNAIITGLADSGFAFLAGFAVFSTVGYIMQALGVPLQDVTISGIGLAFVTYPVGVSLMPALNTLTGVLFFLMFWIIGLSSAYFLAYGGFMVPLIDKFGWKREKVVFWGCLVCFLVGLLYCTGGGLYWLDIIDRTVAFYTLLLGGAIASLVVGWVFGADKLRKHVNATSDIKVGPWMDVLIKYVVPAGLLFVVIYGGFMQDLKKPYGGYGVWANFIWILIAVVLIVSFILQNMKSKIEIEKEGK